MGHLSVLAKKYQSIEIAAIAKQITVIRKAIKDGTLKQYKKYGTFSVRPAKTGEKVDTIIKGVKETTNTAKEGDVVITGAFGEEYIVSAVKLTDRYKATGKQDKQGNDLYKATGNCYAVEYKGKPFSFKASWGEDMIINKGDFMVTLDPDKETGIYRIEREAFKATYKKV